MWTELGVTTSYTVTVWDMVGEKMIVYLTHLLPSEEDAVACPYPKVHAVVELPGRFTTNSQDMSRNIITVFSILIFFIHLLFGVFQLHNF